MSTNTLLKQIGSFAVSAALFLGLSLAQTQGALETTTVSGFYTGATYSDQMAVYTVGSDDPTSFLPFTLQTGAKITQSYTYDPAQLDDGSSGSATETIQNPDSSTYVLTMTGPSYASGVYGGANGGVDGVAMGLYAGGSFCMGAWTHATNGTAIDTIRAFSQVVNSMGGIPAGFNTFTPSGYSGKTFVLSNATINTQCVSERSTIEVRLDANKNLSIYCSTNTSTPFTNLYWTPSLMGTNTVWQKRAEPCVINGTNYQWTLYKTNLPPSTTSFFKVGTL